MLAVLPISTVALISARFFAESYFSTVRVWPYSTTDSVDFNLPLTATASIVALRFAVMVPFTVTFASATAFVKVLNPVAALETEQPLSALSATATSSTLPSAVEVMVRPVRSVPSGRSLVFTMAEKSVMPVVRTAPLFSVVWPAQAPILSMALTLPLIVIVPAELIGIPSVPFTPLWLTNFLDVMCPIAVSFPSIRSEFVFTNLSMKSCVGVMA
ncbi:MAG: hypothetical protein BWY66_00108 [bacterium ADurb.Bin374]|nr:MAG: hypothetical protein BWY66_00108 [bacterium ADurb.Bin374]